jgi:hypothetical protein
MADGIPAECRLKRKVIGDDRVKVAGVMPFYPIIYCGYLTTDFADELMGDRRKEVAWSCAARNMERDAPWTAWSKMLQQRGRVGAAGPHRPTDRLLSLS